jgi:hypothetical protein
MKKTILIVFLVVSVLVVIQKSRKDGFGTSPGTMVQLRTSHVTTDEDVYYYKDIYPKVVAREIRNMTGGDL